MKAKNIGLRLTINAILVATIVSAESAAAAETFFENAKIVSFESEPFTYPSSPFKLRQAKKQGKPVEVKTEPAVPVNGFLATPGGDAPRAAIVLLHPCVGITRYEAMWSDRLVDWGYVVLTVDSFTPRGVEYVCNGHKGSLTTPWHRALDTFGAKRYLSSLSFVDPNRIAVIGMSHGGMTILEAIKQSTSEGLSMKPFQAAIAFYPLCNKPEPVNTPTLILSGDKDQWTPAELCALYVSKLEPMQNVSLKVFAGAHHGFDLPGLDIVEAGFIVRHHPAAAAEAKHLVRRFLAEHL